MSHVLQMLSMCMRTFYTTFFPTRVYIVHFKFFAGSVDCNLSIAQLIRSAKVSITIIQEATLILVTKFSNSTVL